MKVRTYLFLASLAFLLFGCVKDPVVPDAPAIPEYPILLKVQPLWNGVPFDKTVIYHNALGQRVLLTQVKFYLADAQLIGDGTTAQLFDVELLDLTNGPVERMLHAARGDYRSMHLGFGLPYDLNHTDPTLYPVDDPLGAFSGMLWSWASLHRFMLFNGRYDTDGTATGIPPFLFSIETGLDTCYRQRTVPLVLDVEEGDTARLTLEIDIARFFFNSTDTFDLSQGSQWHGAIDQVSIALKLSDLASGAIHAH